MSHSSPKSPNQKLEGDVWDRLRLRGVLVGVYTTMQRGFGVCVGTTQHMALREVATGMAELRRSTHKQWGGMGWEQRGKARTEHRTAQACRENIPEQRVAHIPCCFASITAITLSNPTQL